MSVNIDGYVSRSHRTVLFIDADAFDEGNPYAERVNRLRESLNGNNIKVDILQFRNGGATVPVASGLTVSVFGVPAKAEAEGSDDVISELRQWAEEQGYDQVLFSFPG